MLATPMIRTIIAVATQTNTVTVKPKRLKSSKYEKHSNGNDPNATTYQATTTALVMRLGWNKTLKTVATRRLLGEYTEKATTSRASNAEIASQHRRHHNFRPEFEHRGHHRRRRDDHVHSSHRPTFFFRFIFITVMAVVTIIDIVTAVFITLASMSTSPSLPRHSQCRYHDHRYHDHRKSRLAFLTRLY